MSIPRSFRPAILLGCVAVLLLAGGCATIVNGTRQTVKITSEPSGATATIGMTSISTPGSIRLARSSDYRVEIAKPGYETKHVFLHREFNGWMWGDIIVAPLVVPLIVDAYSGGAWDIEPKEVHVVLEASGTKP